MPEARVAAIVLAAGASTRMGRNKLLLDVAGESLVRRAVRAAIEGGVDEVVVVLGHDEQRVRAELDGLACVPVVNPDHAEGAGTSVRTGVRQAAGADALMVVLADMPFVTSEMIATLARRYRATRAPLVVSHYGDVQAPPTLYDRALFEELLAIPGERCAKQVVKRHEAEAEVVTWPAAALRDIDVPADYDGVRAELAGG
ncbi:MAG TPA: nucleotidyltransferase family protein [Vicinamibacteria bacterium]